MDEIVDPLVLLPDGRLSRFERFHLGLGRHRVLPLPGVPEDAGDGIVVLRGDRIELVIVATGAGGSQAQKGAGKGIHTIR